LTSSGMFIRVIRPVVWFKTKPCLLLDPLPTKANELGLPRFVIRLVLLLISLIC